MPSVNNPFPLNENDPTLATFGTFYEPSVYPVDASTYDATLAYFIQAGSNPSAAKNLADAVFRVANKSGTPAVEILSDLQNNKNVDVYTRLSYYLNLVNSRTTLQGITLPFKSNFYAIRSILD